MSAFSKFVWFAYFIKSWWNPLNSAQECSTSQFWYLVAIFSVIPNKTFTRFDWQWSNVTPKEAKSEFAHKTNGSLTNSSMPPTTAELYRTLGLTYHGSDKENEDSSSNIDDRSVNCLFDLWPTSWKSWLDTLGYQNFLPWTIGWFVAWRSGPHSRRKSTTSTLPPMLVALGRDAVDANF